MRLFDPYHTDRDQPTCCCDQCGGEIYADDLIYLIDDVPICEECLAEFAQSYFAAQRRLGAQLLEGSDD